MNKGGRIGRRIGTVFTAGGRAPVGGRWGVGGIAKRGCQAGMPSGDAKRGCQDAKPQAGMPRREGFHQVSLTRKGLFVK